MANEPNDPLTRYTLTQNPAPFPLQGQEVVDKVRQQTDLIMAQFMRVLPSNYVSRVNGPFYTLQFQAAAEQLALFIVTAQEVFKDSDYDYTRPEFLWQVLGTLVFPGATDQSGIPQLDGDITYREFLKKMVLLLLQGATPTTMKDGVELLTEAGVKVLERFLEARSPGSAFTIDDQFFFDIFVEGGEPPGSAFPDDPFVLQSNVKLVIQALKPAHVLYGYSNLFRDAFGPLFSDSMSWELSTYYYDDFRKFCYGAKAITGSSGTTLSGRTLFSDPSRSFASVQTGGRLVVTNGANVGSYRIREVLAFPVSTDTFARPYTTSPSGLTGLATVVAGVLTDAAQNFAAAVEGETLTFSTGPNAGSYRLETLLGLNGGPVGTAVGPATQVRVSPSMLRIETRMPAAVSGQAYMVDVDRLGVKVPRAILSEDASMQFYL